MLLHELAETWRAVAATRARSTKIDLLADCLSRLRDGSHEEVLAGVAFSCGELRQRQIGVGWASLRELPPPGAQPILTVAAVDKVFAWIGALTGPGSAVGRRRHLAELFAAATEQEQQFLRQLLLGELRQGALAGVLTDAVARASDTPAEAVRRAVLLGGDLKEVASTALAEGSAGLAAYRLEVGRPLTPMLATPAPDVQTALSRAEPACVEEKVDGARVQIHRDADDIAVFTRSLDEVTSRVPELVAAARTLPVRSIVLDGEAIALRHDGRPHPFQVTASRIGSHSDTSVPLSLMFFDVLHIDGDDLLDAPEWERFATLTRAASPELVIRRLARANADTAQRFLAETLARGHEGIVVKSLDAPYAAGRRGAGWLKVKPVRTVDLVVLAAEWGHGRRKGWLSNLHLGARDPDGDYGPPGGFVMLGKTFKGLTDHMLTWQTEHLTQLATSSLNEWVVRVRPELVVEIAFDGVQRSPRYPGEAALRFARVKGYRIDKDASAADTITTIREFLPAE